jgi:hypothetical protein
MGRERTDRGVVRPMRCSASYRSGYGSECAPRRSRSGLDARSAYGACERGHVRDVLEGSLSAPCSSLDRRAAGYIGLDCWPLRGPLHPFVRGRDGREAFSPMETAASSARRRGPRLPKQRGHPRACRRPRAGDLPRGLADARCSAEHLQPAPVLSLGSDHSRIVRSPPKRARASASSREERSGGRRPR